MDFAIVYVLHIARDTLHGPENNKINSWVLNKSRCHLLKESPLLKDVTTRQILTEPGAVRSKRSPTSGQCGEGGWMLHVFGCGESAWTPYAQICTYYSYI